MSFPETSLDHFAGGANLTEGNKHNDDESLAKFLGRFKSGVAVASGAGDVVVAFGTDFPTDDVSVVIGPGSVAGGTVKDGTVDKSGFTITAGGAGNIGWLATHVG